MALRRIGPRLPLALAVLGLVTGGAADWPQFRGPERDGVSRERGLATSWPTSGPKVLWRKPLGEGYAGISVVEGRVYTLLASGADEFAVALDGSSGAELWRSRIGDKWRDEMGDGPRSTPTVDGGLVFALSARGMLHALGAADGKSVWQHDLTADYGARVPQWGVATSPLVEGELLLVDVGGRSGSSIVAFDKKSGKEAWRSQSDKPGYSAPIAITVSGVRQVVFFTGTQLVSLAPADGALYWKVPWETSYDVNAATPIFVPPDGLFISSGYDVGGALWRVKAANGKAAVEQVWKTREMKNRFSSSVFRGGYLYGFDEKILKCVDVLTGDVKWYARGYGHGSLVWAAGQLFVLSEEGLLALVEATPEAYREKARVQVFEGRAWTAPTLAGGRLYLRDAHELVALDVADKG